jgi:acyl carrier protein
MREFTLADLKQIADSCVGVDDATDLDDSVLDEQFDELGYDSLVIYETTIRLREDLDVPISDDEIDPKMTPRQVLGFVNERIAERTA